MKTYLSAPLPFVGQKRIKQLEIHLNIASDQILMQE